MASHYDDPLAGYAGEQGSSMPPRQLSGGSGLGSAYDSSSVASGSVVSEGGSKGGLKAKWANMKKKMFMTDTSKKGPQPSRGRQRPATINQVLAMDSYKREYQLYFAGAQKTGQIPMGFEDWMKSRGLSTVGSTGSVVSNGSRTGSAQGHMSATGSSVSGMQRSASGSWLGGGSAQQPRPAAKPAAGAGWAPSLDGSKPSVPSAPSAGSMSGSGMLSLQQPPLPSSPTRPGQPSFASTIPANGSAFAPSAPSPTRAGQREEFHSLGGARPAPQAPPIQPPTPTHQPPAPAIQTPNRSSSTPAGLGLPTPPSALRIDGQPPTPSNKQSRHRPSQRNSYQYQEEDSGSSGSAEGEEYDDRYEQHQQLPQRHSGGGYGEYGGPPPRMPPPPSAFAQPPLPRRASSGGYDERPPLPRQLPAEFEEPPIGGAVMPYGRQPDSYEYQEDEYRFGPATEGGSARIGRRRVHRYLYRHEAEEGEGMYDAGGMGYDHDPSARHRIAAPPAPAYPQHRPPSYRSGYEEEYYAQGAEAYEDPTQYRSNGHGGYQQNGYGGAYDEYAGGEYGNGYDEYQNPKPKRRSSKSRQREAEYGNGYDEYYQGQEGGGGYGGDAYGYEDQYAAAHYNQPPRVTPVNRDFVSDSVVRAPYTETSPQWGMEGASAQPRSKRRNKAAPPSNQQPPQHQTHQGADQRSRSAQFAPYAYDDDYRFSQ